MSDMYIIDSYTGVFSKSMPRKIIFYEELFPTRDYKYTKTNLFALTNSLVPLTCKYPYKLGKLY